MDEISKTELTKKLEKDIWFVTNKQGIFGCFEVTIGWFGHERVDYLTYDTSGIWRCYEIKVSKSDFHSKAKKTFIGNYNYYCMPRELYEEVKEEIPNHIGVYCGIYLKKRPKKQPLGINEQVLKNSMIRSLSRENEKFIDTCDNEYINRLKSTIARLERENQRLINQNIESSSRINAMETKFNIDAEDVVKEIFDSFKI